MFSDDDLKLLKNKANDPHGVDMFAVDVLALLARLEAAERVADHFQLKTNPNCGECEKSLKAWRKAAGKDK